MKREVAGNTFLDGLLMDMNDFSKSNSTLASCLNGTLVTFNGNEYVLQNDLGNGRVETAYLPENYVPLGTASYGGIIYIVSYNPKDNKCLIGSFPSPERNISSDEENTLEVALAANDFKHGNTIDTFMVKKDLGDRLYSPGDFFLVSGTNLSDNVECIFDPNNRSNNENTTIKLSLAALTDDGKVTILSGLKTYTIEEKINITEEETNTIEEETTVEEDTITKKVITKKVILAPEVTVEENQQLSVEEYRNVISQPYNVFSSKERGKLILITELLCCDSFTISVKNNLTTKIEHDPILGELQVSTVDLEDGPIITPPVTDATDTTRYYSPIISYEFSGNNYVPTGVHIEITSSKSDFSHSEDSSITSSFISNSLKVVGNIELKELIEFTKENIDSHKIITIEVTPVMNWGEATFLKQTKTIDLSKIGTGAIELSQWKYYNDSSKCTIQWGLNTYLEEGDTIDSISMKLKRITDYTTDSQGNTTYTFETLDYTISKKADYNSTFYENIPLDTEYFKLTNGDKIGILVSDKLYLVTITVNKKDKEGDPTPITFYRWLLTNSIFNEYYKTVSDFNSLTLQFKSEIIGTPSGTNSMGNTPNILKLLQDNTYMDIDDNIVPSNLDSPILTLLQYFYISKLAYSLDTKIIGSNLFNCSIENYNTYIESESLNNISKEVSISCKNITLGNTTTSIDDILENTIVENVPSTAPNLSKYFETLEGVEKPEYGNGISIQLSTITNNTLSISLRELYLFKAACTRKSQSAISNGTFIPLVYDDRTLSDYNLIIKDNSIIPYMIGSFAFKEGGGDKGTLYISKFYNTISTDINGGRTENSYTKVKSSNNLYIGFSDPDFVKGTQIQGWLGYSMFVTLEGMYIIDPELKLAYIRFASRNDANENWIYNYKPSNDAPENPNPVFMSDPHTGTHGALVNLEVLNNTNVVLVAIKDRDTNVYYPINFGTRAYYTNNNPDHNSFYDDPNNIQLSNGINYPAYFKNSNLLNFYKNYAMILNNIYRFSNNPITRLIITPKDIYYLKDWSANAKFSVKVKDGTLDLDNITIKMGNKSLKIEDYVTALTGLKDSFKIEVALPKTIDLSYSRSLDYSTNLRDKLLNLLISINKAAILGFDGSTFIGWTDAETDETSLYCRKTVKKDNILQVLPEITKAVSFRPIITWNNSECKFIEASKDSADSIINIGADSQTLFGAMTFTNNLIPYLAIKDLSLVLKNPTNGLLLERITSGDDGLIDGFLLNIGFGNTYRPFKPLLNTE